MYKVLIVEPQEFSLNALLSLPLWNQKIDEYDGFECVKTAKNGQEAIELAKIEHFDLILTELNLTLRDGLQVLKEVHISNEPPLVVIISDIVTFAYAREGFIYGAFDYLPKPVSKDDLEKLFKRAAEELTRLKKQQLRPASQANIRFSSEQISHVLDEFSHQNPKVLETFQRMTRSLYTTSGKADQNPDMLVSELYLTLVDGIYDRHEWIHLYIPRSYHEKIDYLELEKPEDYIAFYQRKFTFLFEKYSELSPAFSDETLSKIYLYILSHPNEDLRLTTISGRFYLNHTYLSNLFSRKSPLRYSRLIAMVKMHRAEFLINYTQIPLEDIATLLGYKDFRYFQKLFRDIIGRSASDYIRYEAQENNYSI